MLRLMRRLLKPLMLTGIGGFTYALIEMLYRGHTHWTMFVVGGLCGYAIGLINEIFPWEMALWKQSLIGTAVVTGIEFISGCIINLWFGWGVWDYSNLPFNVLGQICLPFCLMWIFLVTIWIFADDYLRYWIFKEEKPRYKLW